jgi:hypothetical protein
MNKNQLIEVSVIVVAIIMVFKAFESLISIMVAAMYGFYYSSFEGNSFLIVSNLLFLIIYVIAFFILIKNRFRIINYINQDHEVKPADDYRQIVNISQQQLLYIILVVLTLVSLISSLAVIINYGIDFFSEEIKDEHQIRTTQYGDFKANCIKAIVAGVILYYSKSLSEFFARKNSKLPELEFEKEKPL